MLANNFLSQYLTLSQPLLVLVLVWSLFWKGKALWKAAKNNQMYWFIALLVINTVGILEIIYISFFQKKTSSKSSK